MCHLKNYTSKIQCVFFSLYSIPTAQPIETGGAEYTRAPPPLYGQNIPGSYPYIIPHYSPYGQYPIYQGLQPPVNQNYVFFFPQNNFQMSNYIPPQQSPYNFQMANYLVPQHQWQSQAIPALQVNGSFFKAGQDALER